VSLVRPATPDDIDALAAITEEMDRFYGVTHFESPDIRRAQIEQALFTDPPPARALVAIDGAMVTGFATYSFIWPAIGLTRSLYLKELYVATEHRRSGVGRTLMTSLIAMANDHGCTRVEWTTDSSNMAAQAFYTSLGLKQEPSKLFYRLELGTARTA
jgi:ribosomal protein S18 acetylase RimI-like enzyme